MKFYGCVQLRFEDDSWLREYARNVTPLVERHGGRYLARTRTMEKIEGQRELPTVFVLVEWPSQEAFHAFYEDPAYQEFKHLRHDHSDDELIQVGGEDIAKTLGYI